MYGGIGVSAPSLHRESADSLIVVWEEQKYSDDRLIPSSTLVSALGQRSVSAVVGVGGKVGKLSKSRISHGKCEGMLCMLS